MTGPRRMDMGPIASSPTATNSDAPRSTGRFYLEDPDAEADADAAPEPDSSPQRPERERKGLLSTLPALPAVTLILPNTGSTARDHLASERTWLSYVRTSLGVASTGVALVQLFTIAVGEDGVITPHDARIQSFARPLGAATVCFGIYVLIVGVQRYFRVQHALTQGEFPVARVSVVGITAILTALVAITFGVLVGIPRD